MQYLLLIHTNETDEANLPEDQLHAVFGRHFAFAAELSKAGKMKGGNPLQPTSTATTVRYTPPSGALLTDGPYAETKEQLGGYYLVDCADLDEALALAKQLASFSDPLPCAVEVRPIQSIMPPME